jgi:hypothetical protein
MKSREERRQALVTGTPHEKSIALYAFAVVSDPDPQLLAAIESLLDDRSIVQMYVPFRYGQLRSIAADTLARLRARIGDPRPVILAAQPVPMDVDTMGKIRHENGLDLYPGSPVDEYADLLSRGLVPVMDELYDPAEHVR